MKITFNGAAGMVTGSCHLLETFDTKILVDCGMFQGEGAYDLNKEDFQFDPRTVDYVILTHAHIDHSGRLPKLVNKGFRGKILATEPTIKLIQLLLIDSARIQEYEYKKDSSKVPLYSVEDVTNKVFPLLEILEYRTKRILTDNLNVELFEAGHILGSAIVKTRIQEGSIEKSVVFSGDLGHPGQKIIRDAELIESADYVVMESTYGAGVHLERSLAEKVLLEELINGYDHRSNIIIPTFAVERTQELLFILNKYYENGKFRNYPVYLDSPLGIAATEVYKKFVSYYDEETKTLIDIGDDPFDFPYLHIEKGMKRNSKDKKNIMKPGIVIAGSGMCTGGRVIEHLKNHLDDPTAVIIFLGYQVKDTLGRMIQENNGLVKIDDVEYNVKAKVISISGFSAHADQNDLLNWIDGFDNTRLKKIFLVHGERESSLAFKDLLNKKKNQDIYIPKIGESFTL